MVDLTPGFNLHLSPGGGIPFISKGNGTSGKSTGTGYDTTAGATAAGVDNPNISVVLPGGQDISPTDPGQVKGAQTNTPYTPPVDNSALTVAANNAFLDSQANDLRDLLGRTDTGLNQGLTQLGDSYTSNVNTQQNQENQALQDYADQRVSTNKDKLGAYDTANRNANNGYRSLAQLIGRASGSGSSAYQQLLPDVVGKDLSGKRSDANLTYASNLGNIDTAQKKTEQSFSQVLQDLANQRAAQEQSLRSGVEGQKQTINAQLGQNAAQRAQNNGGGYAAVAAAQQPFQAAVDNSRNSVESYFNQFRPTITAQQAAIAAPDVSGYAVDRSVVNAQNQGAADPTNPYADILRKKLQDQAA